LRAEAFLEADVRLGRRDRGSRRCGRRFFRRGRRRRYLDLSLSLLDGFRCRRRSWGRLRGQPGELSFKPGELEFEFPHSLACADRKDKGDNGQHRKSDHEGDEERK
jgi:hypothetical protein